MPGRRFVEASFPGLLTLAGGYTRRTPGASTDTVLEHAIDDGPVVDVQALGLLQGWPAGDAERFIRRLSGGARLLRRRLGGNDLVRYASRLPRRASGPVVLLRDASLALEAPWMHVEGGRHTIRGQGVDGEPDWAAARLQAGWDAAGVACDVTVRDVGDGERRQWVEVPAALHEYADACLAVPLPDPRLRAYA